jgi:MFS family permease
MTDSFALPKPAAPGGLMLRLGAMFFFETAGVAAYAPLLSHHMQRGVGLSPYEMSVVYATGPIAALLAPLAVGFVADRVMPAERLLAVLSLIRAIALLFAARADSFPELLVAMGVIGFCATPTFVLTSSISLHHLPDVRRFGQARVWGTASWLCVVWIVSAYLERAGGVQAEHLSFGFELAAGMSATLGLYALSLPHTPPAKFGRGALEAIGALGMLKNRDFLAIFGVYVACGALFQVNVILQGLFFTSSTGLGLEPAVANRASSVSQLLELLLFPLLAVLLARFGVKKVVLVGVLAWPLRYAVYFLGRPTELVVLTQLLHGLNVVLGYFALQIAVDEFAPAHRRASTQALLATGGSGLGALAGQLGSGALLARYGSAAGPRWPAIFAFPLALGAVAVCLLAFGYRPRAARTREG